MSEYDPNAAPLSPFFKRWAEIVLAARWPFLLGTLALTAFFAYQGVTKRRIDTSIEAFLATESVAFQQLERLRDDFGRDEIFLLLVEGDVFSQDYLKRLKGLHDELSSIDIEIESLGERKSDRDQPRTRVPAPAKATPVEAEPGGDDEFADFGDDGWGDEAGGTVIDEIISLINARQTRWQGGGLHVGGLLDEWPTDAELPQLRAQVLADRTLLGRVVAPGGRHSAILLRTQLMSEQDSNRVYEEVRRIVSAHDAPGFGIQVAGLPALAADINALMLTDLGRLGAVGLVVMILMMALIFRHPLGVAGPVLVVVQAVLWTLGTMATFDVPMTMITNILPVFVVCVGIGDSVHIQSVYRDAMQRGLDTRAAIVHAVGTTGVPVLFTTLTTAVGLLSFNFALVDAIQDLGTFAALGVALALVHSLVFLPAVLSFNRKSLLGLEPLGAGHTSKRHQGDRFDRFLGLCNHVSRARPGKGAHRPRHFTLATAGAITALSIAGASLLSVYHNPLAWMPESFEIKAAFDAVDEHLSGTADVTLMIETHPGKTLKDRDLLLALEKLEQHLLDYRHPTHGAIVGNVISVLDVVRESHRATHGEKPEAYRVPDTERGVSDMVTLFENAGPDQLKRLATIDLTRSIMTVRLLWLDASSYGPLVEYVQQGIDTHVGGRATVGPTGSALNLLTVVDGLLTDLMRSFGTAFIVITLMMIALLRDLRLGMIAMVPNLLPIAAIMGFMGFVGIPIDLNNILLGSIAIGIAVDDTIHFLHQFRSHHSAHGSVEAAIEHAFAHAGRAMMTTSFILVAGFMVFNAASMYNLQRFGLLVGLTLVLALLVDLLFAPALLRTFFGQTPSNDQRVPGESDAPPHEIAAQ
ncbi:MAG: efflux RND transporter permease subunit [Myxococcales bacterium]|nr:efflux RND transporter permease subunit [Myxococcales bacterium]